jgi:hypothetical protein
MEVKKISFPTQLKDIKDIDDDNIDVFVELDDGYIYTVVIATYKNLLSQMDAMKSDFLEAGSPFIIVRRLTEEIIEQAVKSYAKEDAYWLKLNHLSGEFDINTLNQIRDKLAE